MGKWVPLVTMALVGLGLFLAGIGDADAKRLGGGGSFGGKSAFKSPYKRSAQPPSRQQQAAQQQNATQKAALAKRGGLMGMLGGLALGGLLGALFFGGAFENLSLFDILVVAGIGFALYWFFRMRRQRAGPATPRPTGFGPEIRATDGTDAGAQPSSRQFDTDVMFRKGDGAAGTGFSASAATPSSQQPAAADLPADFDRDAFLRGAEAAYRQLQEAWDRGDLADLRGLTTDAVFAELQDQLRERSGENRTELLKVSLELLEARQLGSDLEASVLFDVLMREMDADTGGEARPYQVREVWHFTRAVGSRQPTWFLDGIQQLED